MPELKVADKETIEQIFDGAAPAYDRAGPPIFRPLADRLVDKMALLPGEKVLDVATGAGAALLSAARRVGPAGHVTGIDFSPMMIHEAESAARQAGLSNVTLRQMDAERLDLPPASFDAVVCAFSLFFFPAMETALREMARVCRRGGRLAISLFGRTPPPFDPGWPIFIEQAQAYGVALRMPQRLTYTPQEVESLLEAAGFHIVEQHQERLDLIYATLADWWAFQLTLGTRAMILSLDPPTRARFQKEHLDRLRPLLRPDGLHVSLCVLYALASR